MTERWQWIPLGKGGFVQNLEEEEEAKRRVREGEEEFDNWETDTGKPKEAILDET